ncbi:MAG: glycoside hydrolase family 20 zincin-like fold domain-containing protein [Armatimonadota bacterium]
MIPVTDRDRRFATLLDGMPRHFSALPHPEGCIRLEEGWRIVLAAEEPRARRGAASLAAFLQQYCGLSLPVDVGAGGQGKEIRLRWTGEKGEGFSLTLTSDVIEVVGDSPAGALYGAHRLQWLMGERGGPLLPPGTVRVEPAGKDRITSTPFHQGFDDAGDPLTYTEGYLDLMAHYGFNGLHLYIDLYDYITDLPEAPEMVDPEAAGRIARLAALATRAAPYNIGIYLHLNVPPQPDDSPLFARLPQLKGARTWAGRHVVCSSSELTTRVYGDALRGIMREVPNIQGMFAIVGGECLTHCFCRPFPRLASGTNCTHCGGQDPYAVVARFINRIAARVWEEFPQVACIVWTYGAQFWSNELVQEPLIRQLDPRMSFMSTYDKDGWIEVDGLRTAVFDYSISCDGPPEAYRAQRDLAREQGLPFFVKTESNISIELMCMQPYIPVLARWQQRWRGIAADKPRGWLANWRFTGLVATLADEVGYRESWRGDTEDTLEIIAARLAGAGKDACLAAWRTLSDAIGELTFCVGLSGFPYWRGPLYLGPAHPLVLHSEQGLRLPDSFCPQPPGAGEMFKGEELLKQPRVPVYFDDLRWTLPLGVERVEGSLAAVCAGWDAGLALYRQAIEQADPALRPALQRELDVARMTGTMFRTALLLARFQQERDRLLTGPVTEPEAEAAYRRMHAIVQEDLAIAREGLELARGEERWGYGFVYGKAFGADMIEAKIAFTEEILLPDLEFFFEVLITHAFAQKFVPAEILGRD